MRWASFLAAVLAACAVATGALGSSRRGDSFSATIRPPPKIQQAGGTYLLRIRVANRGGPIRPFCVDFTDDHNSWDIAMPGLSSWDSDTFCLGLPGHRRKTLVARLIAARVGARKLSILIGKGKVYRDIHRAVIVDDHALEWSGQFVIVG
jgi:hypothetical protein